MALVLAPNGSTSAQTAKPEATSRKTAAPAAATKGAAASAEMTEDEKALFTLGVQIGEQSLEMVKPLELNPAEVEAFKKGVLAGVEGKKSPYPFEQVRARLSARAEANMRRESAANKEKGAAFRAAAGAEPGATTTASGLVFRSLQPGAGERPKSSDVVRVNYRGLLVDGSEFDASKGGPAVFSLAGVVPCWTEGLQLMQVGEKARLVCPPELAYGDQGQGQIAPGSTLVFEVELVGLGADAQRPAPVEQ
jgi:FKBP-type peptidyl-prolyl cis-trans isomerase FkpA